MEVYVVLAETENEDRFFGMALDVRARAFSNDTSERLTVGNAIREVLDRPPSMILRDLLITFNEYDKSVTKSWNSLWIKEERRCLRAIALHVAWEKLQDTKTQYMPKNWPLLGMKVMVGLHEDDENNGND